MEQKSVDTERRISESELIINGDGSVFHLHLRPGDLADTVVLVGDPARVEQVAARFESRELEVENREFRTVTGRFGGRRMSVVSHGIGTDNIDIVMTELDALANIDFETRQVRKNFRRLTLLRLGTSGALQSDLRLGDMVFARTSAGFDGLLNWYDGRSDVCDEALEQAFVSAVGWGGNLPRPYFVNASEELWEAFRDVALAGITISAPGFYGPQGRWVRIRPAYPLLNRKIESFRYRGRRITNYEMESSALSGLAALLGHRAATICVIIAQRVAGAAQSDYSQFVDKMITTALERLARIQ